MAQESEARFWGVGDMLGAALTENLLTVIKAQALVIAVVVYTC